MNKIRALIGVLLIGLLIGCASSPWAGMSSTEVNAWQGIGVEAVDAHNYRRNGFTPVDIQPWIQAGIKSSHTVILWAREDFDAVEAKKWLAKKFTLDEAVDFKKKGLTVN